MTFLDKLERRIGFIAIPGLIRIVVMFTALVCVLAYVDQHFLSVLELKPELIKRGQVWRLVTYIFIPTSPLQAGSLISPLWAVLALWFLWFIGDGLERAWGAFRLTLYFIVGMIGVTIAAFLLHAPFSNGMLGASLFFAFAWFYPDEVIYVMFILPVKIKWLAWITAAFLLFGFATAPNSIRLAMLLALSNYFVFFGPQIFQNVRNRKEIAGRRKRFEVQTRSEEEPLHKCATCGATELSDPSLEFRVARDGEEYCLAHLPRPANAAV
ncbi:MAG TPA: rhomboid family intramembrane serine protease [Chthoniobacterales bacterium]|jgi:membrane associated rhomboid family serine protease